MTPTVYRIVDVKNSGMYFYIITYLSREAVERLVETGELEKACEESPDVSWYLPLILER